MGKYTSSESLLPHTRQVTARTSKTSIALLISLFALLTILTPNPLTSLFTSSTRPHPFSNEGRTVKSSCDQAQPLIPEKSVHDISTVLSHKDEIIKWHQGLIRIKSMSFDQMGEPGEDHRWDVFGDLHAYLEESYPLVHKHLKRTKVDTYGLIFEWFGSDEKLQPLFLTAHQDVVPVLPDTIYQWTQDPWNATYDGEYIWGRGSTDDKAGLTSILASIELLLRESEFKPTRTVILGFGHDEERGGQRGAPAIRDWLLEKYGPDSMSLLVDEGSGIIEQWGQTFAAPAVAEKGKFNLNLTVSTLGGHSSVPPEHTNIGLTALLIAALEQNPHPVILERSSPIWGFLQCAAEYAPDIPRELKKSVVKSLKSDKEFEKLPGGLIKNWVGHFASAGMGNEALALMSTTQAADIIFGGVKVNALPEVVTTIINHRIGIASKVPDVTSHIYHTLLPIAKQYHLAITGLGFTYTPKDAVKGHIFIDEAYEHGHDPAPISPTDLATPAWRLLAGTSRGVWASRPEVSEDGRVVELKEGGDLVMAPFMSTGNTDTRRYWDLTRNIYRFEYLQMSQVGGIHTVNERIAADALVEIVRFFQALILNVDAAEDM